MKTIKLTNEKIKNFINNKDINIDDEFIKVIANISSEPIDINGIEPLIHLDNAEVMKIVDNSEYTIVSSNIKHNNTIDNTLKNIDEIIDVSNKDKVLKGIILFFNVNEKYDLFSLGDKLEELYKELKVDILYSVNSDKNLDIDTMEMSLMSFYKDNESIQN